MTDTGVILAGGKSRRYGKPKGLEPAAAGRPLIAKLADEAAAAGLARIYLSTDDPEPYRSLGLKDIPDRFKDSGPLAGIHSALIETGADSLFVLACDLPCITSREIRRLIDEAAREPAMVVYAATSGREHPLCAVVHRSILDPLTQTLAENKNAVLRFFHDIDHRTVLFEDDRPFLNLNEPDDLRSMRILRMISSSHAHPAHDFSGVGRAAMPAGNLYDELEIVRYTAGEGLSEMEDPVVRESSVRVFLNDQEIVVLQALKHELRELALGFLYTECVIEDLDAVRGIEVSEGLDAVTLYTNEDTPQIQATTVRSVTSGCGRGVSFVNPLHSDRFSTLESEVRIPAERIPELMRELLRSSELFEKTGGVHTAALSDGDNIVHLSDDIGRHNCVDKLLGWELMNNRVEIPRRMILSSGRLSSDIVAKAVRGRIPFVVSHSAPTVGAVQLARKFAITLVGFVRGKRFNIYTHQERITA